MSGGMAVPAIVGFATGVALIVAFALYAANQSFVAVHPSRVSIVILPKGTSDSNSGLNFEPEMIKVVIGDNNTVRWINQDIVPHTVISNSDYIDPVSGNFSSIAQTEQVRGGYMLPGQSFNFTFTKPGVFEYHSEPDPWLSGSVVALAG
jgi:plastocyanin